MQQLVDRAHAELGIAQTKLMEVLKRGPAYLGGSLYVVDLAGADYDHRAGGAQKESAAINKSLLALKECFRSLAGVSTQKPKFRDSKLTRLLEDALCPPAQTERINHDSVSVMLVNVSPAANLEKMTLNTLRYGQMYASGSNGYKAAVKSGGYAKPKASFTRPSAGKLRSAPCDPMIKKELINIYRKHCPEKSEADVDSIIAKFVGREALLCKVKAKYEMDSTEADGIHSEVIR